MSRRALITGGAGFIGSHLAEQLLREGWEVYVLDDLSTGSIDNVRHLSRYSGFHIVVDSVLTRSVVNELVFKCDVVYHLAAAVGVRLIVEEPVRTLVTNLQGTEAVLDCCDRFGKRILIASTSEVYGDHRSREPLPETARRIYGPTTAKRWAYADSKALDEFLALAYHEERGLNCVTARLFNTVGPRQTGKYGMVIPRFVTRAISNQPLEIFGDGSQTRCFCHVDDVVRALVGLMDSDVSGEIYNVGSQESISILDLARRVIAKTSSKSDVSFIPHAEAYGQGIEDMQHRMPDIAKVFGEIGWTPEHDLETILDDVIRHSRTGGAGHSGIAQLRDAV